MKKVISYLVLALIAVGIIVLIKPYIESNELKKQYAFKVNSQAGELSLDSYKGKVLAIYFGYTFCPDVCPTSLSILSQSLKAFDSKKVNENFEGLFISVDPDRDKLDALDEYAKYFHPTFKGATSNKENIDDIVSRYKSFYKKVYLENSSMDYSVSHTSYIYFFDKDGNFYKKVDHHTNPNEVNEVLKALL